MDDADENNEPTLEESVAEIDVAMLHLSIAQIEELIAEQEDEAQRLMMQHHLQRRQEVEQAIIDAVQEVADPPKEKRTRSIRTSEPGELASYAAELFMEDDGKVSVWQEAVAEATDETGNVALTGRIVQLAIGAYYAERRAARKRGKEE